MTTDVDLIAGLFAGRMKSTLITFRARSATKVFAGQFLSTRTLAIL